MKDIPKDFKGDPLDVGTYVVYNLSGKMAIGYIVSFSKNKRQWKVGEIDYSFKIEPLDAATPMPNTLSNVRSRFNLVSTTNLPTD